ncbi:CD225/dispanin family protein [Catelliglobosispora koreensis]|uniref:CD225/dispanin family protein n=1 Tax=Catelliglobosispora koreensis TaxID=129052 RepID=UPI00038154A1|nr:CD225/dispanin family protein [Catelliglobosispora koreensis]
MTTPGSPVDKNLGISIAGLIVFWPIGLFALINALKVDGLVAQGDIAGAQTAADSAKKFGKIAIIVGIALYVVCCGGYVALIGLGTAASSM